MIRKANIDDFKEIKELLHELYPKNHLLTEDVFKKAMNEVDIFVAVEDAKVGGMASLVYYQKLGGKVFSVEDVVVHPGVRSKGIGTKLTEKLIDVAKERGAEFVDVNTRRNVAFEFYKKRGFIDKSSDRAFYSLRYYF